jgi:hypothetical protein
VAASYGERAGVVVGTHVGKHRRKDGTTFPVEVRWARRIRWKRMMFASARDISERSEPKRRSGRASVCSGLLR